MRRTKDRIRRKAADGKRARLSATTHHFEQARRTNIAEYLRQLEEQDTGASLSFPETFWKKPARPTREGDLGKLGLLAEEIRQLPWEKEGLRVVGT